MARPEAGAGGAAEAEKPLRVLFALPGLHAVVRGAEVAFESVARELARLPGFEVALAGAGDAREGTPYRFIHSGRQAREKFEHWPRFVPFRNEYRYEDATFAAGFFRKYDPAAWDATLTCNFPFTHWLLRRRKSGRRPAHIYVTQNGDWPAQSNRAEFRWFHCDGLVCINPEYHERNSGCWNSVLIPNGVDPERFTPGPGNRSELGLPDDAPVVLMVSALIPSKRVEDGIRAAALAAKSEPELHLLVAGDGPLRREIEAEGQRLLGERFRRVSVGPDAMPNLYRCADCVLHMSRDEPFGNVFVEALATGKPIVAHDRNVSRWILEDQARLVMTDEPDLAARAVVEAVRENDASASASRRALAERRFAWSAVAQQYAEFIRQTAASGS
jgi:glycosyltransferase involved in cell wall biosynthesis